MIFSQFLKFNFYIKFDFCSKLSFISWFSIVVENVFIIIPVTIYNKNLKKMK